jgi:ABC-type Fe3+-hydroxamate transport system substrate-binding protein
VSRAAAGSAKSRRRSSPSEEFDVSAGTNPSGSPKRPLRRSICSANIDKILALRPDLVLTFSDLQADIAADLIRRGLNLHAFNQQTVAGILDMIRTVGALVDATERTHQLVGKKFRPKRVMARPGFVQIPAVQYQDVYEIKSSLILQPGSAALTDGLAELQKIIGQWAGLPLERQHYAGRSSDPGASR